MVFILFCKRLLTHEKHENESLAKITNHTVQLQSVFYSGFSKWNITPVQTSPLGKILLAEKSDNRVLYHVASQIWQLLQHGMGLYAKPKEGQELLSFLLSEVEKKSHVLQNIFGHDFLSQCQHVLLL